MLLDPPFGLRRYRRRLADPVMNRIYQTVERLADLNSTSPDASMIACVARAPPD
jgi:hypothetical protein